MLAWLIVLSAFFILAVQLFITLIEFKLTTLAGFVLIPFALFNETAFLAERVLGNIVPSGVKMLVLAVIFGIGTGLFGEFTAGFGGRQPTLPFVTARQPNRRRPTSGQPKSGMSESVPRVSRRKTGGGRLSAVCFHRCRAATG